MLNAIKKLFQAIYGEPNLEMSFMVDDTEPTEAVAVQAEAKPMSEAEAQQELFALWLVMH